MKIAHRMWMAAAMAVALFAVMAAAQKPDVGWYTRNPRAASFKISTADELAGLATLVNRKDTSVNFAGKTITLVSDIDLSKSYGKSYNGGRGWIPIGYISFHKTDYSDGYFSAERSFQGIFDGSGKTISGLYINDAACNAVGLFGAVLMADFEKKATVKNLGVINVDIRGNNYVGGVIGYAAECDGETCDDINVTNCYSTGTVSGSNNVGGVVGWTFGDVSHCYSTAAVSGKGSVGGVVGGTDNSNVSYCYSTGTVSGDNDVGGVVGGGTNVLHCYSTGTVSGNNRVGGVAGIVWVHAHDAIVGDIGKLSNCYSTGAVSGRDTVGGVVGYGLAQISSCVALNPSVKSARSNVGRIVGTEGSLTWANHTDFYYDEKGRAHLQEETYRSVLFSNSAFAEITNNAGNAKWSKRGHTVKDGADRTAAEINADGTLGGQFTAKNGWKTQNGKLPGFGSAVDMPKHLEAVSNPAAATAVEKTGSANTGVTGIGYGFSGDLDVLLGGLMGGGGGGGLDLKKRASDSKVAYPSFIKTGTLTGGRRRADIQSVVMQNMAPLRDAYNKRLREKPGLNGKITVKFAVDEFGKVISAAVVESTMGDPDLENTLVSSVRRWDFKRVDIPGDVTEVTYPFVFSQ